jgi:glycosyltransferase involved in cell wall biosynthesis
MAREHHQDTTHAEDRPGVALVTFRSRETTQNATYELLAILSRITAVSLITVGLSDDSPIRDEYEVSEVSDEGTGRSIPTAAIRFLRNQFRVCRAIARSDEEVVLFFGATAYLLPTLFARLIGRTVVIEPRGDVPLTLRLQWEEQVPTPVARALASVVRGLERLDFHVADAIITYTPSMAGELNLEPFRKKLHTQGARHVPVDRFRPTTPYAERDRNVGFVGRLDVEKGIDELIEVARLLPDDVSFVFVGDGDYRDQLEAELADEIAAGSVEVTGWVDHDEVPVQLNRLKLLVMPSQPTEGLPSTILEAFACGTPVYATPVAGVPDVVRDGETGFSMTDLSAESIAADVESILARDDLEEISGNCRALLEAEYSFDATVDRYREMLADIHPGFRV